MSQLGPKPTPPPRPPPTLAPTLTSDRECKPCAPLPSEFFDTAAKACKPTSVCLPGAKEDPPATATSDRVCAPSLVRCQNSLRSDNGQPCTCPDEDTCSGGCLLPQQTLPQPIGATLRLLDRMYVTTTALGTCSKPANVASGAELAYACFERCNDDRNCAAFDIQTLAGTCCLYAAYATSSTFAVPGAAFYSMPQCDMCTPTTHYKEGRACAAYALPPSVEGGSAKRVIDVPLSTPTGTTLLTLAGMAEPGFAPLSFSLAQASALLAVEPRGQSGELKLKAALTMAGTISVTVRVQDARSQCTLRGQNGQPVTTAGGCVTAVSVDIRVAVFLSCPGSIVTLVPLGDDAAEVAWSEPTLPAYLGDLAVTRDVADTASTASPFLYGTGTRRVTYRTEALTVGGSIECAFDVTVLPGYEVEVGSIGRKAAPTQVQEFLVIDIGETSDGARLPNVESAASSGGLSLGLTPATEAPFTITPQVRENGCSGGAGKPSFFCGKKEIGALAFPAILFPFAGLLGQHASVLDCSASL